MAIITYEGFENYSSFDAVKSYLNYNNYGTMSFISATDANGVTPRNGGSCIKFTNSSRTYPRFLIKSPNNATNSSGVFGFAWYPLLPAGGGWGNITPIAAIVDGSGRPHFYVTVNRNLNVELRVLNTPFQAGYHCNYGSNYSHVDHVWNIPYFNYDCDVGFDCNIQYYLLDHRGSDGNCDGNHRADSDGPSSTVLNLLGSSNSLITMNAWNYIEVKYSLSTSTTGYVQLKLNRNANDSTLDIDAQNVKTTFQSSPSTNGLVFGIHWSRNSANTASLHASTWTSYFDDIYWADLTGATNNNFLGRVSCKKFSYNNVVNYDMTTPANSATALSNFNETFSGVGSISTRNTGNIVGQTLDVRSTGVSNETLSPIFVRQYVQGYKTETASDIALGATDGVNNVAVTGVGFNSDSINGTLKFRDYDNAPDSNEWTNQKIADTTFKHTII
jgi:hypothetical protein